MPRRYTYATSVSFGGDEPTAEFEVEVSFLVAWGMPETPPAYTHGGLPADPDEICDIRVETVDGKARPWDRCGGVPDDELADAILAEIDEADLHTAALEQEAARAFDWGDEARDRRRDDELTGASQ